MKHLDHLLITAILIGCGLPVTLEAGPGTFDVTVTDMPLVKNLSDAETVFTFAIDEVTETPAVINYEDPEAGIGLTTPSPFPIDTPAGDQYFALKSTATVIIPTAGDWTFAVRSDDGFGLDISGSGVTLDSTPGGDVGTVASGNKLSFDGGRAADNSLGKYNFSTAGSYDIELLYFEILGQAGVALYANEGDHIADATLSDSDWELVGDTGSGGLGISGGTFDVKARSLLPTTLDKAVALADAGTVRTIVETPVVNFVDPDNNTPSTPTPSPFPGDDVGVDENLFLVEATAKIVVNPGELTWTFLINSDDGFGLSVDPGGPGEFVSRLNDLGTQTDDELKYDLPRFLAKTRGVYVFDAPGVYDIDLTYWEGLGRSNVALFALAGSHETTDISEFLLVGDSNPAALQLFVPEPGTYALLAMSILVVGSSRRAKKSLTINPHFRNIIDVKAMP